MTNTTKLSTWQLKYFAWIVAFIVPISGVCVDIYVPSLPHIATAFSASNHLAQLTIVTYLFGLALGQFITGPISDSIGRKPLVIMGSILQILCILLIVRLTDIHMMIILRIIQGFVVSLIIVPTRAVILDLYSDTRLQKNLNLLTIAWALGPILAPFIGGYLQHYFDWQATFYFMLGYTLIILAFEIFIIKETIQKKSTFTIKKLINNYTLLCKDPIIVSCLIIMGIMYSYMLLFNLAAPFFMQNTLGLSPIQYGRVALIIGASWLVGNLINRIITHASLKIKTYSALLINLLVTLIMLYIASHYPISIYPITIATCIITINSAIIFSNLVALGLKNYRHMGGTANAFLFAGTWLVSSVIMWISSTLKITTLTPLVNAYIVLAVFVLIFFHRLLAKK